MRYRIIEQPFTTNSKYFVERFGYLSWVLETDYAGYPLVFDSMVKAELYLLDKKRLPIRVVKEVEI